MEYTEEVKEPAAGSFDKRIIWLILAGLTVVLVLVAAIISPGSVKPGTSVATISEGRAIAVRSITNYILETNTSDFDENTILEWDVDKKHYVDELYGTTEQIYADFINAAIAQVKGEDDEVVSGYYNNALISSADAPRVKGRACYEMGRICLNNEKESEAKEYFNNMHEYLKDNYLEDYINLMSDEALLWNQYPGAEAHAIHTMEDAMDYARDKDYSDMEKVLRDMAYIYETNGRYTDQITCVTEGLTLAEIDGDMTRMLELYVTMGTIYDRTGNYEGAMEFYAKALEIYEDLKDVNPADAVSIEIRMATSCVSMGRLIEAEKHMNRARRYMEDEYEGVQKRDDETYCHYMEGLIKFSNEEYQSAIDELDEANKRFIAAKEFCYPDFNIQLYSLYGKIYYKTGDYNNCYKNYAKVEKALQRKGSKYMDAETLKGLMYVTRKLGRKMEADQYSDRLIEVLQNNYETEQTQHAAYLMEQFASNERQSEINRLKLEKQIMIIAIIVAAIVLAGVVALTVGLIRQIKKGRVLNAKLKEMSEIDSLTKLNNRRTLNTYMEEQWPNISDYHRPVSVIMMDVDYFKKYNDNYGHVAGDEVLRQVSASIRDACRKKDFAVRYGGEEFLIIMPDAPHDIAMEMCQRIKSSIEKKNIPHEYSLVENHITVSIGFATAGPNDIGPAPIRYADEALYEAKQLRNNISFYKGSMNEDAEENEQ